MHCATRRSAPKLNKRQYVNTPKLISAEQPFAALAFASTELLHRVAETGREAVSLLLARPRNVDGAILCVRPLG